MKALILARGGSKGLPNKNVKLLEGKPLIVYPIEAALLCPEIDGVFVSTDNQEIAQKSRDAGATIIDRPDELCQDDSLDIDGFKHFVETTGIQEDLIHLRATTPLIDPEILSDIIMTWNDENRNFTALRSIHEFPESIAKFVWVDQENRMKGFFPVFNEDYIAYPRQKFETNYLPNGYCDIVKPEFFMSKNSFYGDKVFAYKTERVVEVDSLEDFEYLCYIKQKQDVPKNPSQD
jgi:CMP-N-acetylneuraminic acid synthetase